MLEIGSVIDEKYKILNVIGKGGMSTVYLAMNEKANRQWAIKELQKGEELDFQLEKNEIELMKKLRHSHLPEIADVIEREDSMLIVMDYIEGKSLEKLYAGKVVPQKLVLDWALQLCEVLSYLHAQNPPVIYRDMKPANVMLRPDGQLMLIDFGAAREYRPRRWGDTVSLGTKGYAAPEQYRQDGLSDARTDIYCLGVMLFELLTGENPHELRPIREVKPELSSGLESIICKCTQAEKEARYRNCEELAYALSHYWELEESFQKAQRRKLFTFLVPAACSLLLCGAAVVFRGLEWYTKTSNYDLCLQNARYASEKEDELLQYERAIRLDPKNEEAYLELLSEGLLDDDILTAEESERLRKILLTKASGEEKTQEQIFLQNKAGYAEFAYQAGIAYFYKLEEVSNKKNAAGYFSAAAVSDHLNEAQIGRSTVLQKIADYYTKIGVIDAAGDELVTYGMYWQDLKELCQGNLVETDNERTALVIYEEMISQIVSHASDFQGAGVSAEEIKSELSKIAQHLQEDFEELPEKRKELIKEELRLLKEHLEHAEDVVSSVFFEKEEM